MLLIYQCTAQQNVESQLLYLNYFSEVPTYVIRAIPFGQLPNPNHQLWLHREGRRQPTQPQPTQRTWHIPSWPYTTWHHSVSCREIVVFLCNLWLCLAPEGFFFFDNLQSVLDRLQENKTSYVQEMRCQNNEMGSVPLEWDRLSNLWLRIYKKENR